MIVHAEVQDLWMRYRISPSMECRNRLVEYYLPLVNYHAERLWANLPDSVQIGDLVSDGAFGLMEAIEAFDQDRGVKFETYCAPRIRGAMLDGLRGGDWVPRLVRSQVATIERARRALEIRTGNPAPPLDALAAELGMTEAKFKEMLKACQLIGTVSLSTKWYETDNHKDVRQVDILQDQKLERPEQHTLNQDLFGIITKGLNPLERCVVGLYYFAHLTMKKVGQRLDLSESRVSQLNTAICKRLAPVRKDLPEILAGGTVLMPPQLVACLVAAARVYMSEPAAIKFNSRGGWSKPRDPIAPAA